MSFSMICLYLDILNEEKNMFLYLQLLAATPLEHLGRGTKVGGGKVDLILF